MRGGSHLFHHSLRHGNFFYRGLRYCHRCYWGGGSFLRGLAFSGFGPGLQQTTEPYAVVLFLVALLVSFGTELSAPAGESFEQRKLLATVQATHMRVIGS